MERFMYSTMSVIDADDRLGVPYAKEYNFVLMMNININC
jgi:hypothetical protein